MSADHTTTNSFYLCRQKGVKSQKKFKKEKCKRKIIRQRLKIANLWGHTDSKRRLVKDKRVSLQENIIWSVCSGFEQMEECEKKLDAQFSLRQSIIFAILTVKYIKERHSC